MALSDISSGSAAGLMSFLDFMSEKGYATPRAMEVLKSAARQIFTIVEGEDFDGLDVANLNLDEYLSRFENRSMGRYSAKSLVAYRSRFRRGVESYRSYLEDPNWMPSKGPNRRKSASATPQADSGRRRASAGKTELGSSDTDRHETVGSVITYPFPLESGQMAQLRLPTQLSHEDAERLVAFVRALVLTKPSVPSNGEDDDR